MMFVALIVSWIVIRLRVMIDAVQHDDWFYQWADSLFDSPLANRSTILLMIILLLAPVLVLGLILEFFGGWLFGLVEVAINIVVILYALGRGMLYNEIMRYRSAWRGQDKRNAYDIALQSWGVAADTDAELLRGVLQSLAYRSYAQWFAPAFWFLLLGAPGALFYALLQLAVNGLQGPRVRVEHQGVGDAVNAETAALLGWVDYVPARLWVLVQMLVSDFNRVWSIAERYMLDTVSTPVLLVEVQNAAIAGHGGQGEADTADMDTADHLADVREVGRVFDRSMLLALALFTIVYIAI